MENIQKANSAMVETGLVPAFEPGERHPCAMTVGFTMYLYMLFGATYGNVEMVKDLIEGSADSLVLIISLIITAIFAAVPLFGFCMILKNKYRVRT